MVTQDIERTEPVTLEHTEAAQIGDDMYAPKGRPVPHRQFTSSRTRAWFGLTTLGLIWLIALLIVLSNSIYDRGFAQLDQLFGSRDTVVIAVQGPMTGPQAEIGAAILQGVQLAIDQQHSMVEQGRDLDILIDIYDDQSNPVTAIANARALASDPDVIAIIGHTDAQIALPAADVYSRAHIPVFYPAISNAEFVPLYPDNSFFMLGEDTLQGRAAAELVQQEVASTASGTTVDILVVTDDTEYSSRVAASFLGSLPDTFSTVIKQVRYSTSESEPGVTYVRDIPDIAALVDPDTTDLIYFSADAKVAAELSKTLVRLDRATRIWGPDILNTPDLRLDDPIGNTMIWYTTPVAEASDYDPFVTTQFVSDYTSRFGAAPTPYALESYDAATIVLQAIMTLYDEHNGEKPTREAVIAALKPSVEPDDHAASFFDPFLGGLLPTSMRSIMRDTQPEPTTINGLNGPIEFNAGGLRTSVSYFLFTPHLPAAGEPASVWNRKITTITLRR